MIDEVEGMPEGTTGLRCSGSITADDYRQVLEPTLRQAVEAGDVRFLYLIDDDFDMSFGAKLQDARIGISEYRHHSAWKRTAIVTDVEWLRKSLHALHWMVPGEIEVFPAAEIEQAKQWVAA